MAAKLKIQDGSPIWLSNSIVPSKDTVVSPTSTPTTAVLQVNSTNVFVYVKVENTGTLDLGGCTCTATGAWPAPSFFSGFFNSKTAGTSASNAGFTFQATTTGDFISGPGLNFSFGLSASGRRAWAWSPDNRFFAYVGSPNGNDWFLSILALQTVTRANGTTVNKGQIAASANGIFPAAPPGWNNSNFGWAGAKALIAAGQYAGGPGFVVTLACPLAPSGASYGDLFPDPVAGQLNWKFLASPCGENVCFAPARLSTTSTPANFFLVSTATAMVVPFKSNNVTTSVSSSGANVSLTTVTHSINGVRIGTGNGTNLMVDDPECSFVGGTVMVTVDRVKASTLPSANLGVLAVGTGSVAQLAKGKSAWVQVPNTNGWANQSEKHWCLLAQAYTQDGTTIAKSWNGQAASPPAFPVSAEPCAQRNIEILP